MISITGPLTARNLPAGHCETSGSFVDKNGAASFTSRVKWRNQMLALVCLLLFGAVGVLYFRTWVVQKPFAIILFVGEGLTAQRLAATRVYTGGADTPLAIDALEFSARIRNHSLDFAVPDAAAAASALATGAKVKNGALSVEETGAPLPTILELARVSGRSTGIVTDGALTNPTAAAFYAHSANAKDEAQLASALLQGATVDVALGGGSANFARVLGKTNVHVVRSTADLEKISAWQRPRVLGIFAEGDLSFSDEVAPRAETPSLADMVRHAIALLQMNRRGYVLVVDAHLMGAAAAQNAGERTLRETAELDRAVQVARDYAGTNVAIVVTGDVAIGGMNISGFPYRYNSGVAVLGMNSAGQPWITWATGPNGQAASEAARRDARSAEPAAVSTHSALNTIEDPVASAAGLRIERVAGTIDSTQIFALLRDVL
jgi:alkaline phosphatase